MCFSARRCSSLPRFNYAVCEGFNWILISGARVWTNISASQWAPSWNNKNGIKESIHVHHATIKLWKLWAAERIWLSAICNYICEENCIIKILWPKDWFSGRIMHNSINSIIWNSTILYSFVSVILTMMVYYTL